MNVTEQSKALEAELKNRLDDFMLDNLPSASLTTRIVIESAMRIGMLIVTEKTIYLRKVVPCKLIQ